MCVRNIGRCSLSYELHTDDVDVIEDTEETNHDVQNPTVSEIKNDLKNGFSQLQELEDDVECELDTLESSHYDRKVEMYSPISELGKLLELAIDKSSPLDKLVTSGHSRNLYIHNIPNQDVWINESGLPPMLAYKHRRLIELMEQEWGYEPRKGVYILETNIQSLIKPRLSVSPVLTYPIDSEVSRLNDININRVYREIPRLDSLEVNYNEEIKEIPFLKNKIRYGVDSKLYTKVMDNFPNVYPVILEGKDALTSVVKCKYTINSRKLRFVKVIFMPYEEIDKYNSVIAKKINISLDTPDNMDYKHRDVCVDNIRIEIYTDAVKTFYVTLGKKVTPLKSIVGDVHEGLIHTGVGTETIPIDKLEEYGIYSSRLDARKALMDKSDTTHKQLEVLSLMSKLSSIDAEIKMSKDKLDISSMRVTIERYKLEIADISSELEKLKLERGTSEVFGKTLDNSSKLINSMIGMVDTILYVIDKIN